MTNPAQGEIILYQPDDTVRIEVRMEGDTVWLNRQQIALLFDRDVKTIGKHINNALRDELASFAVVAKFATTAKDGKTYQVEYYNLDMILSVGYRVKSEQGIRFRQWANKVLKEYLMRGYAINERLHFVKEEMDARLSQHDKRIEALEHKVDFFVRTNQPPVEGVFFEGQIFDAYKFAEKLVQSAQREVILIDNYIDASVFDLLQKRGVQVTATIYTDHIGTALAHIRQLSLTQYGRDVELWQYNSRFHDRFLIIDDALYHIGASIKDLGRRPFAFERMGIDKAVITSQL